MSNIIPLVNATTDAFGPGPRLLPTRTLVSQGVTKDELKPVHLEGVRDYLARMAQLQEPKDYDMSFSTLHINFNGGRIWGQRIGPGGLEGDKMLITKNAFDQMCQTGKLMPAKFGQGLLAQSALGEKGGKLSTMSWALWSKDNSTPRMFRTANIRDENKAIVPCIKAQVSNAYAKYDNLDFVQDLLDHGGELTEMPVLDFRVTDRGMRLRFTDTPMDEITLETPVAMYEAWNSEIGQGSTLIHGGAFKYWCLNGCGSWEDKSTWRYRHYGDTQRIRDGVEGALHQIRTQASGVLEVYGQALDIAIDDAFAFIEKQLAGELTKDQIAKAQTALGDETTTPGGRLASAVDAVTLIAQEYDMYDQFGIERAAGRMMRRGQAMALASGNNRIQMA